MIIPIVFIDRLYNEIIKFLSGFSGHVKPILLRDSHFNIYLLNRQKIHLYSWEAYFKTTFAQDLEISR